ncbi:TLC domain-containing protein [Infundibulicybe gibba]|nr:TLC domain-containing protein [Infundibulicybe gibba]
MTQSRPLGSPTPERSNSPRRVSPWLRCAIRPSSSIQILFLLVLYASWDFLAPYLASGYDLVFIAYNIVFFSLFRQVVAVKISRRVAGYFGIKKEAKLERFGEQGYALVYFAIFGAWGSTHPLLDYPHWQMMPELKRYYLMQLAYWCQQLLVLVLGLEKPRKDYWELVAHHIVTLWLGPSMDIRSYQVHAIRPNLSIFLKFSKLLNYIQWERAKVVSFVVFVGVWTYFRHYPNLVILWLVRAKFSLAPDPAKQWNSKPGVYMPRWMQDQIFLALGLLQLLNVFWYYLIIRIAVRYKAPSRLGDLYLLPSSSRNYFT